MMLRQAQHEGLPKEPQAWVADYIGLPFKDLGRDPRIGSGDGGVDCWGLVRLVYAERLGIELPSFDGYHGTHRADAEDIARLIGGACAGAWREVDRRCPWLYDVAVLRIWGRPMHVGLVVARGCMLHVIEGVDSVLERYDGANWINRVVGVYRWV